jgi:hypothetical protein
MKNEMRSLLVSAKVLQLCADLFAVFGIFLFAYMYFEHWNNSPWRALKDPMFVTTLFLPFIPAACFAYAASKKRRKIRAMLEEKPN